MAQPAPFIIRPDAIADPKLRDQLTPMIRILNSTLGSVTDILTRGISLADNLNASVQTVTFQMHDTWEKLSLLGGWSNADAATQGTCAVQKLEGGLVIFRGRIAGGSNGPVAQLSGAYAPAYTVDHSYSGSLGSAAFSVNSSGTLSVSGISSSPTLPLSVVGYVAGDPSALPNHAFPFKIAASLPRGGKVLGVFAIGVEDVTDGNVSGQEIGSRNPVAVYGCPAWTADGSDIRIWDVPGLVSGRNYNVRFVVLGQ